MREPRAHMPDIQPSAFVAHGEHQRTKPGPCSPRRREPHDHGFLTLARLDLEPVLAARAGEVTALGTLGHDAFEAQLVGLLEQPNAMLRPMLAVDEQDILR